MRSILKNTRMNKEDKNTLFWMGVILVSLIAAIIIHLYQYPLT